MYNSLAFLLSYLLDIIQLLIKIMQNGIYRLANWTKYFDNGLYVVVRMLALNGQHQPNFSLQSYGHRIGSLV